MVKMQKVGIRQIIEDDKLTADIYTEDAVLLATEGTVLNTDLLGSLSNYSIYIVDKKYSDKVDNLLVFNDEVKKRCVETMSLIYSDVNSTESIVKANELSSLIVNSIMSNESVSINLDILKCSDEYTYKHSVDVASMAVLIGKTLKLGSSDLVNLAKAGLLHDVGKVQVPKNILHKTDKLSNDEFSLMQLHPLLGYNRIQNRLDLSFDVKQAVLQHHEKIDGTGYPSGIDGYTITYYARIIAVADVYDALVTDRPYREAMSPTEAIETMNGMFNHFDLQVYKAFLDCVVLYPVGSIVRLSDSRKAEVIQNHRDFLLRPVIKFENGNTVDLATDLQSLNITIIGKD